MVGARGRAPVSLRSLNFSRGLAAQALVQLVVVGLGLCLTKLFQVLAMEGALHSGVSFMPESSGAVIAIPIAGILFDRIGVRLPMVVGSMLLAFAAVLLLSNSSSTDYALPFAVYGVADGLTFMLLMTYLLRMTPAQTTTGAVSLISSFTFVVKAIAAAIVGHTLIFRNRLSGDFISWYRRDFPKIVHQDLKIMIGVAILTGIVALSLVADTSADRAPYITPPECGACDHQRSA